MPTDNTSVDMQIAFQNRSAQADLLRGLWDTHTQASDGSKDRFFDEVERAVIVGRMAPVSLSGDGQTLIVATKPEAARDPRHLVDPATLYISFQSPDARVDFVRHLRTLLQDDPHANLD